MTRLRTIAACHAEANRPYVEEPFRYGQPPFHDGLTGLQHARAHLAAMSPERRAQLEKEWNDG